MAIYRNIQMSFWTDTKVIDDFSPEDKYVYLYLMTNPHTNLCGCYELSMKQASIEVGYSPDVFKACLHRLENEHGVIKYSESTKEVLIINWGKYNWTNSKDVRRCLDSEVSNVKNEEYQNFLRYELECGTTSSYEFKDSGKEELPPCYEGGGDLGTTISKEKREGVGKTDSLVSDSLVSETKKKNKLKESKHVYGEYQHVKLSDAEYFRLVTDYGEDAVLEGIRNVDEYCQEHGKKYSDYNLVLRKWGIKAPKLSEKVSQNSTIQPKQDDSVEDEWANLTDDEWEEKMRALDFEEEFNNRMEEGD